MWYDIHGASHVRMASSDVVLVQHFTAHSEFHTQRPHHWPIRPHVACVFAAHPQRHKGTGVTVIAYKE